MTHSSVNGIVTEKSLNEFYELILDNSRAYLTYKPNADAKAMTSKNTSKGKGSQKGCFNCGQLDHWATDCPNPKSTDKGGKG